MTDIAIQEPEVYRPSAAINPQRLEYLWSLAERIASSSLVPESLRTKGNSNNKEELPREQVVANVFAVCEQADRWNQSPFALLSCAAIVHGKLGFEGKVIAAVLEANFGIILHHYFTGEPTSDSYHIYLCDQPLPQDVVAQLRPGISIPGYKIMDGDVATWKTTGNGSPWRPSTYKKMLIYRGVREWSRIHKPAAVMGVLADDELLEIDMERRAQQARNVTPSLATRFGGQTADGFNADNVTKQLEHTGAIQMERFDQKTGEIIENNSGTRAGSTAKKTSSQSRVDESAASAKSAHQADGASDSRSGRGPTNSSSSPSSSQGDDEQSSGGASSSRAPAGTFGDFSTALLRFGGTGKGRDADMQKLSAASEAFWSEKGGKPDHPADVSLSKQIISAHLKRMAGDATLDSVKTEVAKIIDDSFNSL